MAAIFYLSAQSVKFSAIKHSFFFYILPLLDSVETDRKLGARERDMTLYDMRLLKSQRDENSCYVNIF